MASFKVTKPSLLLSLHLLQLLPSLLDLCTPLPRVSLAACIFSFGTRCRDCLSEKPVVWTTRVTGGNVNGHGDHTFTRTSCRGRVGRHILMEADLPFRLRLTSWLVLWPFGKFNLQAPVASSEIWGNNYPYPTKLLAGGRLFIWRSC